MKDLLITGAVYLTIDIFYITLNSKLFNRYFRKIQGSPLKFKTIPAIATYLLLTFGLYYFIIKDRRSVLDAFFLGVFVYGVYDLTNYATLKNWTLLFSLMDMLWGGIVFALSTFIIYKIQKYRFYPSYRLFK